MEFLTKEVLAYIFAGLMGLSMLIYAVLDGYDLGIGILTKFVEDEEKDKMIASIGPFWDANETWLVLGVGILLVIFPKAHGVILTELYLPVGIMLFGLIFRGVAFDFRAKVPAPKKEFWNNAFFFGSLTATLSQGFMLGNFILGFEKSILALTFSFLVAIFLVGGYCLVGSAWLIYKTSDAIQKKAVNWAKKSLIATIFGIILISITTPLVSSRIFERWFSFPEIMLLAIIPFATFVFIAILYFLLKKMPFQNDDFSYLPFLIIVLIFVLCFDGLAYSFFPYIIPEKLQIIDATIESRQSMLIIFFGTIVVLPILISYTIFVYRVFSGKASELSYN